MGMAATFKIGRPVDFVGLQKQRLLARNEREHGIVKKQTIAAKHGLGTDRTNGASRVRMSVTNSLCPAIVPVPSKAIRN